LRILNASDYKTMSAEEVLHNLETSEEGLTSQAADGRLRQFGYNEIQEVKRNPILEFLKRYWGPMPWLLEIAIVLTVVLEHYTESIIIFALLTINAVIGYFQSRNSHKAVEMLK